jgi:electron transfer flavoprotein alpha subunit
MVSFCTEDGMDLDYLQSLMGGDEVAEEAGGYQDIWVVGETVAGELTPLSAAVLGKARELANGLGAYVKGILFGVDCEPAGEQMIHFGADSVALFDAPALVEFGLEPYVEALASAIELERPEIVLWGATSLGGELAPRLAARFGGPCFTHCIDLGIDEIQRALLATAPRMGGEYYEILSSPTARPQFATVEEGSLPAPYPDMYRFGEVTSADLAELPAARVQSLGVYEGELAPTPLAEARAIVCVGRGLHDEEGVGLAGELADALGGQVAGTRGAFDEGWIDEARVVGMGGISVRPALYVACGVSGAIQHVMGMEEAGYVVAITDDPHAEIIAHADVAMIGDAKEIVAALNAALRA